MHEENRTQATVWLIRWAGQLQLCICTHVSYWNKHKRKNQAIKNKHTTIKSFIECLTIGWHRHEHQRTPLSASLLTTAIWPTDISIHMLQCGIHFAYNVRSMYTITIGWILNPIAILWIICMGRAMQRTPQYSNPRTSKPMPIYGIDIMWFCKWHNNKTESTKLYFPYKRRIYKNII
jgi:hypothetical protein